MSRGPELYGKKRWTEEELHIAAMFASRVYQKNLTLYKAMKLCHVSLPGRTESACREIIRKFVTGKLPIDAADIWFSPIIIGFHRSATDPIA